jgi:holo-[acyl-carrier protein] synthase
VGEGPAGDIVGVGVDLVDVGRMRVALARTPGLVARVFTDGEVAWATAVADSAQRFAARFAAKEAVLKSLGVGLGAAPLRDVEVVRADSGAPHVVLHGNAASLADARGVSAFHLSLSHVDTTAMAMVVAVGSGRDA